MDKFWLLAFVITPAAVVALGWVAVLLHERAMRERDRRHHRPAE